MAGTFKVRGVEYSGKNAQGEARAAAEELCGTANLDTYGRVSSVATVVSIQKKTRDGWRTVEVVEWNDGKVTRKSAGAD